MSIRNEKTQIFMNKAVYSVLSIVKKKYNAVIYEFWCGQIEAKYGENGQSCYMNTDSFMVHIKAMKRLMKWKNNDIQNKQAKPH